jgi:hypothetical protein
MLMKPGATVSPRASISLRARAADRSPIAAMRPREIPMSATKGAAPVPSQIEPPRISVWNCGSGA